MKPRSEDDVIVVSGLPRSGTSMMMRMLDAAGLPILTDSVRTADEDNPKGYWEFEPVKDLGESDDTSWLADARGKVVKIVSPLIAHLPTEGYTYRVLFMRRDARATCWSNYRHNFAGGGNRFGNDLADLGHYYRMHHDLMTHWSGMFAERVHTVPYERLTENQEVETRKILAAADLDWEDACLEFHKSGRAVRTASASQVRKKMYKGSSEAWRRYEPFLGPMLEALGDLR